MKEPAFFSYTAPAPADLDKESIRPSSTFYCPELSEFILLYEDVRQAESPKEALMEFLQSTYEAGANLAKWDRIALEQTRVGL